jgi:hypothetical protein
MGDKTNNCHGCKWLDEIHSSPGCGYCAMVTRLPTYKQGARIRVSTDERCELYKAGDFKTRWQMEENNAENN